MEKTLNTSTLVKLTTTLDDNIIPVYVCVVDDEVDLASLFRDALSQIKGIEVFSFSDPNLALEHIRSNSQNYKLVITDHRMPGMTGLEFLDQIKDINPTVTRILISAFEIQDTIFQGCNCVDKFLQKPISMVKLIDEVEMLVNPMRVSK